jgi:hypothetical protein
VEILFGEVELIINFVMSDNKTITIFEKIAGAVFSTSSWLISQKSGPIT